MGWIEPVNAKDIQPSFRGLKQRRATHSAKANYDEVVGHALLSDDDVTRARGEGGDDVRHRFLGALDGGS